MKKGFTLAEVMITLTVIGIITAIILPVAFHSKPDKDVMKFKKAHNTLYQVISTLINSDKYYLDGKFTKRPDGSVVLGSFVCSTCNTGGGELLCDNSKIGTQDDVKYFCKTFGDVITTKSTNCSTAKTGENDMYTFINVMDTPQESWQRTQQEAQILFDKACLDKAQEVGAEIVTPDDVIYYQVNPAAAFGICWYARNEDDTNGFLFDETTGTNNIFNCNYKTFCIDIDGINKGEDPFGYGINVDGRIINGKRATDWLEKSIQGEN